MGERGGGERVRVRERGSALMSVLFFSLLLSVLLLVSVISVDGSVSVYASTSGVY